MKESSTSLRSYVIAIAGFGIWWLAKGAPQPSPLAMLAVAVIVYVACDFRRVVREAPVILQSVFFLPLVPVLNAYIAGFPHTLSLVSTVLTLLPVCVGTYLAIQVRRVHFNVREKA